MRPIHPIYCAFLLTLCASTTACSTGSNPTSAAVNLTALSSQSIYDAFYGASDAVKAAAINRLTPMSLKSWQTEAAKLASRDLAIDGQWVSFKASDFAFTVTDATGHAAETIGDLWKITGFNPSAVTLAQFQGAVRILRSNDAGLGLVDYPYSDEEARELGGQLNSGDSVPQHILDSVQQQAADGKGDTTYSTTYYCVGLSPNAKLHVGSDPKYGPGMTMENPPPETGGGWDLRSILNGTFDVRHDAGAYDINPTPEQTAQLQKALLAGGDPNCLTFAASLASALPLTSATSGAQ